VSDLSKLKKFLDDDYRVSYLDSHVKGSVAYQIQALREKLGLNQTVFGALVGMPQSVISRLENAEGGSVNINTLLKIANGLKIGLAVRFCNFEVVLAEDVSPAALLVEGVSSTIQRISQNIPNDIALVPAPKQPTIESTQIWQTEIPNQPPSLVFPASGTLSFERYTPTPVLPDYHLST
jgi:transcriptional regulator with XRE-family HTH domain